MKLWMLTSYGATLALLFLCTVFCNQGDVPGNDTAQPPCSLDDGPGCRNASEVPSSSVALSENPGGNSSYEPTSTPYSEEFLSTTESHESEAKNTTQPTTTFEEAAVGTVQTNNDNVTALLENKAVEQNATVAVVNMPNTSTVQSVELSITPGNTERVPSNTLDDVDNTTLPIIHNNNTHPQTADISVTILPTAHLTDLQGSSESESNYSEEFQSTPAATLTTLSSAIVHGDTSELPHIGEETTTVINLTNTSELSYPTQQTMLTDTAPVAFNNSDYTVENVNVSLITKSMEEPPSNTTEMANTPVYNATETWIHTSSQSADEVTDVTTTPEDTTVSSITVPLSSKVPCSTERSSSVPITTTVITTEASTNISSDLLGNITTTASSDLSLPPHGGTYVVLEFKRNCSGSEEKEISSSVAQILNASLKDTFDKDCSTLHNVTLLLSNGPLDFATIYKLVSANLKNAVLIRVIYNEGSANMTSDSTITVSDNDVTESEMILYITLGVCLGAIFLIALAIMCFKCCRRRPSKPVDLDVPHLNLRLEDYTLTRIPRPNTVYLDYFRGPILSDRYSTVPLANSMNSAAGPNRGLVQPFDTSVVPLEDAKKLDELATSPGRTASTCPSTPLRTFGRKDWKRGDNLIYENVISSSTEKLHPDYYKYGYPGMENPTFAA